MPEWAGPLIRHRHLFKGTALVIDRAAGGVEYWKLVFMVQSPAFLAMSRLHPADEHLPCSALHEPRDALYHFRCNYADFSNASEVAAPVPADRLSILFRLIHNGGTYMSSDMYPISLPRLLAGQQEDIPMVGDEEKRAKKAAKKFDEFLEVMPWLQHLDVRQGFHGGEDAMGQAHRHSVRERSASSSMQNLELDEESRMAALSALDKERIATAGERVFSGCVDFASRVRGGGP